MSWACSGKSPPHREGKRVVRRVRHGRPPPICTYRVYVARQANRYRKSHIAEYQTTANALRSSLPKCIRRPPGWPYDRCRAVRYFLDRLSLIPMARRWRHCRLSRTSGTSSWPSTIPWSRPAFSPTTSAGSRRSSCSRAPTFPPLPRPSASCTSAASCRFRISSPTRAASSPRPSSIARNRESSVRHGRREDRDQRARCAR